MAMMIEMLFQGMTEVGGWVGGCGGVGRLWDDLLLDRGVDSTVSRRRANRVAPVL